MFGATVLAAKRDVMHPEDTGYSIPGLGDPGGDLFNRLYPYQAVQLDDQRVRFPGRDCAADG